MGKTSANTVIPTLVAVLLGLALGLSLTLFADENPLHIARLIVTNSFGTTYDLGFTLFYTAILTLTGLAVVMPFRAGMFNIGAEGQLSVGCFAALVFASSVHGLPPAIGLVATTLVAMAGGALWGGIAGWLRAWRGSHEVITTIMLNYLGAGLINWLILAYFRTTENQRPESVTIDPSLFLSSWPAFEGAPFSSGLWLAPIMATLLWVVLRFTVFGYKISGVGENERALEAHGVATTWYRFAVMALAGAVAGLVAVPEILGASHRYRIGFSADYGFTGIGVALMARGHPLAVLPCALLFAVLHKGTSGLDLDTDHLTRDYALILQGTVVFAVACSYLWNWWQARRKV